MNNIALLLKKILNDHHMIFFTGVMFILAGMVSLLDHVIEAVIGREIEFFHGMLFLGIFNLCMSLVFMVVGAKNIESAEEGDDPPGSKRLDALEKKISALRVELDALRKDPA